MAGQLARRASWCLAAMMLSGCVINIGGEETIRASGAVTDRNALTDAARPIENTPWPEIEKKSLLSWVTGGEGDGPDRGEAIKIYLAAVPSGLDGLDAVMNDAARNVDAGRAFQAAARRSVYATRVTMDDISVIERAIQTLRENRDVFVDAVDALDLKSDAQAIDTLKNDFDAVIKDLGETADRIVERIENDRTAIYAKPDNRVLRLTSGG